MIENHGRDQNLNYTESQNLCKQKSGVKTDKYGMSRNNTYKGIFIPINEEKYIGNITGIVFRSSWEKFFMTYLDQNYNVKRWASEELVIPYYYPLDEKMHRYFPDFYVEFTNGRTVVIEIKPHCETLEPILKKGGNKRVFADRMATYLKNIAKWEAAKAYCLSRGWEFSVFTEKHLAALKKK